mmetsp:Transcript_39331/g.45748  ORF Transcript_39331/g.45748 Transcript_39331/m.45748 type:complete len:159 (+) Transcript_39331:76-552(+)
MATASKNQIPIDSLSPQQLDQVREQLEKEITSLTSSLDQFKIAHAKFEDSKNVLKNFGEPDTKGSTTLIPITSSLYIQGEIEENKSVLVDYGTGYYVERSVEQAIGFCERKAKLIQENKEKLTTLIMNKKKAFEQIEITLAKKIQAMQAQAGPQKPTK